MTYRPFFAEFTFREEDEIINCRMRCEASSDEIFEAAATMISAAVGGLERAAMEGKNVAEKLRAMRAARDAFRSKYGGGVSRDDSRILGPT